MPLGDIHGDSHLSQINERYHRPALCQPFAHLGVLFSNKSCKRSKDFLVLDIVFKKLDFSLSLHEFLLQGLKPIQCFITFPGRDAVSIHEFGVAVQFFFSKLQIGPDLFSGSNGCLQA